MTPQFLALYHADQQPFVLSIRKELAMHKKIIAQAVTGYGKTKCFIAIISLAVEKGTTVLVLTESKKIFAQIIKEQHGRLISAGSNNFYLTKGCVYIAMSQTLKRRPFMIKNFAALGANLLVISDEAHVGTSNIILNQLPDAYIIGFTATPDAKASPWIPKMYNKIVTSSQPWDLVKAGRLSRYKHYERQIANLDELETDSKGEFTEESNERVFDSNIVFDGMLTDLKTINFKKAIVFTSSIKHCEHVYADLTAAGFNCACVHSERDEYEIDKYTKGNAQIAVSVGQITKGFDYGPTDLIVLDRAIGSLPLYLQCCGRGSRISPGKTHFTVLDYGMNKTRLGYWIEDRDWVTLAAPRKKREKLEAMSVKQCPQCEAIIPVSTRVCPFCGYAYPASAVEEPPPSKLVDVTPEEDDQLGTVIKTIDYTAAYQTIKGKNAYTLTPLELSIYARHTGKSGFATLIARFRDANEPDFLKYFIECMGYDPKYRFILRKRELPKEPVKDFVIH